MATAEEKTVVQKSYLLILDEDEAAFLLDLVYRRVNGAGASKITHEIWQALERAGVDELRFVHLGDGIVTYREPEVPAEGSPKVGDRVRALGYSVGGNYVDGQLGTLREIDSDDTEWPYRVEFCGKRRWVAAVDVINSEKDSSK
jgi:hypothetical protein